MGGVLYEKSGPSLVFATSGLIMILNIILCVLYLKESLRKEYRRALTREACMRLSIVRGVQLFSHDLNLKWLGIVYFANCLSTGVYALWYIYVQEILDLNLLEAVNFN